MARGRRPLELDARIADGFAAPPAERPAHTADRLAAFLRGKIMRAELVPGAALPEATLATALGISRSPVREAMRRLSAEGVVRIAPQSGNYVAAVSVSKVREGAFIRATLEERNIADLAARIGDEELARLRAILAEQDAAVRTRDARRFHSLDEGLHAAFFAMTDRTSVWTYIQPAKLHADRARVMTLGLGTTAAEAYEEHAAIVDSLARRDPAAAADAMRAHLSRIDELLVRLRGLDPELVEP